MFPMLSMLKSMIKLFCLQEFKVLKAALRFLFQKMDKWLSSMDKREKFMWLKTTKRGSLSLRKTLVKLDTSHKKTLIVAPEGCKSNKCLKKQKTEETMWKLQYFSSLILPVTIKRDTEGKQNINSGQTVGPCGIIWSALPTTWETSVQILPEMS